MFSCIGTLSDRDNDIYSISFINLMKSIQWILFDLAIQKSSSCLLSVWTTSNLPVVWYQLVTSNILHSNSVCLTCIYRCFSCSKNHRFQLIFKIVFVLPIRWPPHHSEQMCFIYYKVNRIEKFWFFLWIDSMNTLLLNNDNHMDGKEPV